MKSTTLISSIAAGLALYLLPVPLQAQENSITYLLPGNKAISADKLDSVAKAWGGAERMSFAHSAEDDKNNIMHLQRITDEDIKKAEELKALRAKARQEMITQPAPEWTATDINGNTISLHDLKGKIVVMNFWFTSCSPCIREMPHLNNVVAKYKSKDVVFVAFAQNDEADIRAFLAKRPFNYTQIPHSKTVNESYAIESWPTSIVIDKEGKIRLLVNYDQNIEQVLTAAIEAAL